MNNQKCWFCQGTGIDQDRNELTGIKKCVPCNGTGEILPAYRLSNFIECTSNYFPYWRANGPSDIETHRKAVNELIGIATYLNNQYKIIDPSEIEKQVIIHFLTATDSKKTIEDYPYSDLLAYYYNGLES